MHNTVEQMDLVAINARAESAASPNKQLLIHFKVMVLKHMLALQKLETIVQPLVPSSLRSITDFSAQHDQTELIKQTVM